MDKAKNTPADSAPRAPFDLDRMKSALAGPTFDMPPGLNREKAREFILAAAMSIGPLPAPAAPSKTTRYSLDELLSGFDPERHGGELMACPPVGKEFPLSE
jgi:hypothetical protein